MGGCNGMVCYCNNADYCNQKEGHENQAPNWYRTPIRGPALGRHMRKPGCNGAVCYCNSRDFCNENDATRVESKAASHPTSSALLLLTLFVCSLLHGLGTTPHPGTNRS